MSIEVESKDNLKDAGTNNETLSLPPEWDKKKALSNRWLESLQTEGAERVRERLKSSWDSIAIICALISGFSFASFFQGVSPTNYSSNNGNWELSEIVYLWSQALTFIFSTSSVLLTVILTQQIVHIAWFLYTHPNVIRFPVMAIVISLAGLFVTFCCGVFLFMDSIACVIIISLIVILLVLVIRIAFGFERSNDKYMVLQHKHKGFTEEDINLQSCGGLGKKMNDTAACCCCIKEPNVYRLPIKAKKI